MERKVAFCGVVSEMDDEFNEEKNGNCFNEMAFPEVTNNAES